MTRAFAIHDVDAKLDYGLDWSAWLSEEQTIALSEWSGPAGVSLTQNGVFGAIASIRVEITDASLVGRKIELVNHVTSSDGQEEDETLRLYIVAAR